MPYSFTTMAIHLALVFFTICSIPKISYASDFKETGAAPISKAKTLIRSGGFLLKGEHKTFAYNQNELFIPASIWKIATASAAIATLGPDFRFKTEIYQTKNGDLYVKGYGAPFLISEEIDLIVSKISKQANQSTCSIFIDQSAFELQNNPADGSTKTLNPYDAGNYPVSVNFNTIFIDIASTGQRRSAEPQTPTLPIMSSFQANLSQGKHRINISRNREEVARYAAELLKAKLFPTEEYQNGNSNESVYEKHVPKDALLLYEHIGSKTLLEIVAPMLLYSNNFIANQLFLTTGAKMFGYPATWKKARKALASHLKEIGMEDGMYAIEEGSGLSRKNKITPRMMVRLLEHFQNHANLLPLHDRTRVKTGTLTGVYSYAGYLDKKGDKKAPFVIMLNQGKNRRDRVMHLLKTHYQSR